MEESNTIKENNNITAENNNLGETKSPEGSTGQIGGETPKKNSKKWLIVLGVGLVFLVVAAIVAVVLVQTKKDNNEVESENNGYVDVDDDVEDKINTELTSGSVTTTIGGKSVTYNGAYVVDGINATISSGTYESANDDEVVFLVINGGSLVIDGDVNISKTGSANFQGRGDNYSFYGTNSAIVVVGDGSSASINGVTINTSVSGANAVVATNGGAVGISDSIISTTADNSRGLHATYSGSIEADDVSISTLGGSCATLATDRGAGTVIANDMKLSTAGAGSPLIYSTGEISVSDSTGTATGAQVAVVEGKNSITLEDCDFSTNGIGNRNNVDNAAIMIYQSMSGDALVGKGSFTAIDCTLTVLPDSSVYTTTPFFFVTNTTAEISLTNVAANFYSDGYFVLAAGTDEWGRSGSNGGVVTIDANNLTATNTNIGVDEISSVEGLQ